MAEVSASANKPKSDFLQDNFDKLALVGAVLVAGAYFYFGVVGEKPNRNVTDAKDLVTRVSSQMNEPHENKKPPGVADLYGRTERTWKPFLTDFQVKPWTGTYNTEIKAVEGLDKGYEAKVLKQNTEWYITKVEIQNPETALDSVTIRWFAVEPEKKNNRIDPSKNYPDNTFPQKFNAFTRFELQRQKGGTAGAKWEKIAEFTVKPEEPFAMHEHKDDRIEARTVYAYRVLAEAPPPAHGRALGDKFTTKEVSVKTQNVWFIEIKYILPAGSGRDKETAVLEMKKFDLEKKKMFGPKEFRVVDGDTIGVIVKVDSNFKEIRIVEHPVKDPDTKKDVMLNWDTGFKVLKIERGLQVEFTVRRPGPEGKVIESKRAGTTDRVTYRDDEGKERFVWTKDPAVPIDEKPREKKPEEPKPEEKKPGG